MSLRWFLAVLFAAAGFVLIPGLAGATTWRPVQVPTETYQACAQGRGDHAAGAGFDRNCGARITRIAGRERQWGGPWFDLRRLFEPPRKRRVERPSRQRKAARSSRSKSRSLARRPERREARRQAGTKPRMSAAGTFRTLCVRTCDGYYFPISFSTTRDHFGADQAACERICPGAESRVYYHRASREGPEQMVSLEGGPYTDLPTAFSYRSALNPSCSCRHPDGAGQSLPPGAPDKPELVVPLLPRPRQARGEDPETLANRFGHFAPRLLSETLAGDGPRVQGGIRIVEVDRPAPVLVSPVPNDLATSLLWARRE